MINSRATGLQNGNGPFRPASGFVERIEKQPTVDVMRAGACYENPVFAHQPHGSRIEGKITLPSLWNIFLRFCKRGWIEHYYIEFTTHFSDEFEAIGFDRLEFILNCIQLRIMREPRERRSRLIDGDDRFRSGQCRIDAESAIVRKKIEHARSPSNKVTEASPVLHLVEVEASLLPGQHIDFVTRAGRIVDFDFCIATKNQGFSERQPFELSKMRIILRDNCAWLK